MLVIGAAFDLVESQGDPSVTVETMVFCSSPRLRIGLLSQTSVIVILIDLASRERDRPRRGSAMPDFDPSLRATYFIFKKTRTGAWG